MTQARGKIVHLTSVHRPFDVRIWEKECKSLVAAGYEVVLVAVYDRDRECAGVQIKAIPQPQSKWQRMTITAWSVFREACRQRADLYQIHDPELLPWALVLRLLGKTVVYDMHENVPKDILAKSWLPSWLRLPVAWLVRCAERLLLFRLPVVFAEHSYASDYRWIKRSVVILNLPNLAALPLPSPVTERAHRVGYIGGVAKDRGSEVTLEALRLLKCRGLNVGWDCVGPTWPPAHGEQLRTRARQYGLLDVHLHGYRPGAEGWTIIRDCFVGIAVLDPIPNFVDSYPTKIFEYMALAIPVITSDFPLYRAVIDENQCGMCVDPSSALELADAIERLVREPALAQQMGQRGRQAVLERYNWSTEFAKLQAFYEPLLLTGRKAACRNRTMQQPTV